MRIGILGIGVHLPPTVRRNDFWPEATVRAWQEAANTKVAAQMTTSGPRGEGAPTSEGAARVSAAIARHAADPFRGTRERRVLDKDGSAIDMEIAAARQALQKAEVSPADIDAVMTFAICPDFLNAPSSATLRTALGLPSTAFACEVSTVCNSFHSQLALAEALIRSGKARHALLVQSSAMSRMALLDDPSSAWFGDGATAVVVGPVSEQRGLLGWAHRSDASLHKSLVHGVPGKRWFDAGRVEMYTEDRGAARRMLLLVADQAREVVSAALAAACLSTRDVDFYAGHQSTCWMLETVRDYVGLSHAQTTETFSWAGTLSAANIPLALTLAADEGRLRSGQVIATFAPGTGMTYSSCVMRWGR